MVAAVGALSSLAWSDTLADMHPPRPLDYETPRPPARVGFLTKCNPRATPRSVVRKAVRYALVAAAAWVVVAAFKPAIRSDWRLTFPALVCSAALVGAVFEWQVDDEGL